MEWGYCRVQRLEYLLLYLVMYFSYFPGEVILKILNYFSYLLIHCSGKRLLHMHMNIRGDSKASGHQSDKPLNQIITLIYISFFYSH